MKKKIGIGVVVLLIGIQFIRIDKQNPEITEGNDIISILKPNEKIVSILKTSCYDCHSNEAKYPWYSNLAPVSWVVGNHIEEAREHVSFSEWGNYSTKEKAHKLEECAEEVEEKEMPLFAYELMHGKLSTEDRELLEEWFKKEEAKV